MSPYETAARWHMKHCPETSFADVIEAHFQRGAVFSDRHAFVLGRVVMRDWPESMMLDPWEADEGGDCWHVWLWAGTVRDWQRVVPYPLPWISFHRGDRLRLHRFPAGK